MLKATRRYFWVLRNVLGMTGTKFGCDMALCGACTVHVDGAVHVRPDGCEVWVGTQAIVLCQTGAAKVLGLQLDKVEVHNHLLGGGFGQRLEEDGVVRAVQRKVGALERDARKAARKLAALKGFW